MTNKILILSENPPDTYKNALSRANLIYDCKFKPDNYSDYSGLLLIGGGDVLPAFYGGETPSRSINFVRDKAEFDALKYFTENSLPVFAVCRGFQVLNVFFGGTLKRVENHFGKNGDYAVHKVKSLSPSSFPVSAVNSYHAQAVDKLGKGGKILMVAEDGVIEAASFGDNALGVQFHPERMEKRVSDLFYNRFALTVRKVFRGRK